MKCCLIAAVLTVYPSLAAVAGGPAAVTAPALRTTQSLNGTWQIAEGSLTTIPSTFDRTVPVPGLVDLASPAFVDAGPKMAMPADLGERFRVLQLDPRREAFWYKRAFFVPGPLPANAHLKIGKAMFGTKVWVNGMEIGEHKPCFTPGVFNVRNALRVGTNDVVVRVGASRGVLNNEVADGFDFEKCRYIPGIFDSVELILTGRERIANIQVAPDLKSMSAKVRVYLDSPAATPVTVEIREAKSARTAGRATTQAAAGATTVDLTIPVTNCRLWSPEDPFLYQISVRSAGDELTTRFGMREFKFDPATRRGMLNGKPYYMRGSNISLYRFFEDSERAALPWDESWVRQLHREMKGMHWNTLRYSLGFPPEKWYEIADEEGLLIQDEFPFWTLSHTPKGLTAEAATREFLEWMRERWNHPCVFMWDTSNECGPRSMPFLLEAVRKARAEIDDLTDRPWDSGYMLPERPGDPFECHPYHWETGGLLSKLGTADPVPQYGNIHHQGTHAVIINEYGWLWINRDGSPTTLTRSQYGNDPVANRHKQATWLAADTEFWRHHRKAAAVMEFSALSYSRPDGQTSDHWLPGGVAQFKWDPVFRKYVRDAFAPVGVMIDSFAANHPGGKTVDFPVSLVNDLEQAWHGKVRLRLLRHDGSTVKEIVQTGDVAAYGTGRLSIPLEIPTQPGTYRLQATLLKTPVGEVSSWREFTVGPS